MKNRIRVDFLTDIRKPITSLFLLVFFFGSMATAGWAGKQFDDRAEDIVALLIPKDLDLEALMKSQMDTLKGSIISNESERLRAQYNAELEGALRFCKGNRECEEAVRTEVGNNINDIIAAIESGNSMLEGDLEMPLSVSCPEGEICENPLRTSIIEAVASTFRSFLDPNNPLYEQVLLIGLPLLFLGGLFLFLVLSPLAWPLSFATMMVISLLYWLFRVFGIFQITHETVKREVIV